MKKLFLRCMLLAPTALLFANYTSAQSISTAPIADAHVRNGTYAATPLGAEQELLVRTDDPSLGFSRQAFFMFDTSQITGDVSSATLWLSGANENPATGSSVRIAVVPCRQSTWIETQLTYNNAPQQAACDFNLVANGQTTQPTTVVRNGANAFYGWDVAAIVNAQRASGRISFALVGVGNETYRSHFASREASTNRPRLEFTLKPRIPVLAGQCPAGFTLRAGENRNFPHEGMNRAFYLVAPPATTTPMPVWFPLQGTIGTTSSLLFGTNTRHAEMANSGFLVISPVRQCSNQNYLDAGGSCSVAGLNGWNWRPWNDGRAVGPTGVQWENNVGPDARFFEAVVRCAATQYQIDASRIYLGGISAGGTVTNRTLTFNTGFWAGGLPVSGEWYALSSVAANPTGIIQGRVGPTPLKTTLPSMIVLSVWGGPTDTFPGADYRASTQAASNYYSSFSNVVHIGCTSNHGHAWPYQPNDADWTRRFNQWALTILRSHPKGTPASSFSLSAFPPPPSPMVCSRGRYTDHY